ncbi:MAG: hypothetical protein Q9223_005540 [Gallowayella weberi]
MAKQPSPDGRLVYLHCSAIFSGSNAKIRKAKKVVQLLEEHRASIKILTNESSLPAIAAVAKELLEQGIFESLDRARLRYPELFRSSETQEAERAASEAEVVRIEVEAAHDKALTSDYEEGDECRYVEKGENLDELKARSKAKVEPNGTADSKTADLGRVQQATTRVHELISVPRLHPVYLPFKTQHRILVLVQSILEECCLEFGNTWVPDLMKARQWNEAESIELTDWTKRFSKYVKTLPSSAIKQVPGKSIVEVLYGTSSLRHTAVHRLPTSAAGILNMLLAAVTFAEALKDSKRAERILEIKTQLDARVEEIVQHQNLLERKLTAQFEDIARRRAELDELERSAIEEMLATDKEQRTEIGSAIENLLLSSHQVANPCGCSRTLAFEGARADLKAEKKTESSHREYGEEPLTEIIQLRLDDQTLRSEKEFHTADSGDESPTVAGDDTLREKALPAADEEPPVQAMCSTFLTGAEPKDEPQVVTQSDPLPENTLPATEVAFRAEGEDRDCQAILETSKAESDNGGFDGIEERKPQQNDEKCHDSNQSTPEIDLPSTYSLLNIMSTALHAGKNKVDLPTPPSSEPSTPLPSTNSQLRQRKIAIPSRSGYSTMTTPSVPASSPSTKNSHLITLEVLNGDKKFRSIVSIRDYTRTAIFDQARAYFPQCGPDGDHESDELQLPNGSAIDSVSLHTDGRDMDLSMYKLENLSSLVMGAGIPTFTVRVS